MSRVLSIVASLLLAGNSLAGEREASPRHPSSSFTNTVPDTDGTAAAENSNLSFWVGIAFGYGLASPVCASCGENGPQGGTTANVHLGFGLNRNLFLGVQASLWINDGGIYNTRHDKTYRNSYMIVTCYSPWAQSRFFGKAGVGWSVYNAYDRHEPRMKDSGGKFLPSLVHGEGLGALFGIGYDLRLSHTLSLSPTLSYSYGHLGRLDLNEAQSLPEERPINLLELNLALTFRSAE